MAANSFYAHDFNRWHTNGKQNRNKHPKKWPKIHFYKEKFGMRLVKSICVVCIGRLYIHSVLQVRLSFVGYPSERTYIQFEKLTPIINY